MDHAPNSRNRSRNSRKVQFSHFSWGHGHFSEVLHTNWMQIWMLQTNLALAQKHKHIQTPNLTLFQALPLGFGELRHPEIPVLTPLKQLGNKHPPNLSEQRRLLLLKACHICSCLLSTGNLHNCWDWSLYWNSTLMLCCCLLLVLVGKSRRVDVKTSWRVRGWKETSSAPKCHQVSNYSDLISLNISIHNIRWKHSQRSISCPKLLQQLPCFLIPGTCHKQLMKAKQ